MLAFHFSDLSKPTDCNTKLPFICEKYNVSSLEKYSPDSAAKVQCSEQWIPFQNKVKRELLHYATMIASMLVIQPMAEWQPISDIITEINSTCFRIPPGPLCCQKPWMISRINSQVGHAYRSFKVQHFYFVATNT